METACCIMQNLLELLPEMKKNNIGETDAAVCYPILSREMHVDLSGEHSSLLLSLALSLSEICLGNWPKGNMMMKCSCVAALCLKTQLN